jgi:hypothetical protein
MTKVICIKFTSGEEVIARVSRQSLSESDGGAAGLTIEKVRTLALQPVGNGNFSIAYMPWVVGDVDGTFDIRPTSIITTYPPDSSIEKDYLEQTTGIAMSSSSHPSIQM